MVSCVVVTTVEKAIQPFAEVVLQRRAVARAGGGETGYNQVRKVWWHLVSPARRPFDGNRIRAKRAPRVPQPSNHGIAEGCSYFLRFCLKISRCLL
jgi:hypothetical protein